jgi:UPF0755 protein
MVFNKTAIRLAVSIPLLLLIFGAVFLWSSLRPVSSNSQEKIFVINKGEGIVSVASRLEKQGVVRNRYAFLLLAHYLNLTNKIQAGSFRLSPASSPEQIARSLTVGRLDRWLVVIEGWRREQIAQAVEKNFSITAEEFLAASKGLEGYLFPDSYLVPVNAGASTIVKLMRDNFDRKVGGLLKQTKDGGLSPEQVLVIASLVEREARFDSDRPLVAGVLINRLKNGWPLQVDATVQYAKANRLCRLRIPDCQDWWPAISQKDLSLISPYNTYLNKGLPPTPISNPSLSSIKAVINYQGSDYWFYLSDQSGKIHFSRTLKEHQEKIRRYLGN